MAYTAPTAVSAGDALTATLYNTYVKDNIIDHESRLTQIKRLGYQERTTQSDSTGSSFATTSDLFGTSITFTADGTSKYRVEFGGGPSDTQTAARDLYLGMNVSGTETGHFHVFDVSSRLGTPIFCVRYITPTAGSKTINFRHYHGAGGMTTIRCGDGTGSNYFPMFMAVYGPDLT